MANLPRYKYKEYIQSSAWRQKRKEFFASDLWKTYPAGKRAGKFVCYCCSADERLDLHHRSYARLGSELISNDLICVCRDCHNRIHELQREGIPLRKATKLARKEIDDPKRAKVMRKTIEKRNARTERKKAKKLLTS